MEDSDCDFVFTEPKYLRQEGNELSEHVRESVNAVDALTATAYPCEDGHRVSYH